MRFSRAYLYLLVLLSNLFLVNTSMESKGFEPAWMATVYSYLRCHVEHKRWHALGHLAQPTMHALARRQHHPDSLVAKTTLTSLQTAHATASLAHSLS